MAAHGKIFVSYRREDAPGDARSIYEWLGRSFGEKKVFMDVDQLLAGQRFDRELDKAIAECDVLIAVIGPRWMDLLSEQAKHGKRDYVRQEIAAALQRDIIVIPVMMGREANMPPLPLAEDLPENIRDLVLYQKHNIAHESFGRDATHLIGALKSLLRERRGPRHWRAIAVSGLSGLVLTGVLLGYWTGIAPLMQSSTQRDDTIETVVPQEARAEAKRNAEEAERQRLAAAKAEAERKATQEAQLAGSAAAGVSIVKNVAVEGDAYLQITDATVESCSSACVGDAIQCKMFAYAQTQVCYLFDKNLSTRPDPISQVGFVRASPTQEAQVADSAATGVSIVKNVAVEGDAYLQITDATVESCSSACVGDAIQCKMFAYARTRGCYLFDKILSTRPDPISQVGLVR